MKAILIDTPARECREVELTDITEGYGASLLQVYHLLGIANGSRLIQTVPYATLAEGDLAYVDEEGLLRPETLTLGRFVMAGNSELLAGRGIVIGTTPEGEWCNAATPLATVKARVGFPITLNLAASRPRYRPLSQ